MESNDPIEPKISKVSYEFAYREVANLIEPVKLPEEDRIVWPPDSVILYAINEKEEVIGRMGVLQLPHIEGTWIREDKRSSFLLLKLMAKMEAFLIEDQRKAAFAFIENKREEIQSYMERLGYTELPLKVYVKNLVKEEERKVD